ncbi:hypothetical protein [Paraglaciecola sp.]|uniref:hypothetical protein n=1 Tax=Paraglaciecola sp. TaxID=1920173 RepID=UPI003EF9889E
MSQTLTDKNNSANENIVPRWFLITSIILLIWNLMGVMAFAMQITMTPEQISELPAGEQNLYQNIPLWVNIAFACAVIGGTLGCLALCLKKAIALPILLVSVVGVLVQMYHSFFMTNSIDVLGSTAVIMPSIVIIVALILVRLAQLAGNKGWLN